MEYYPVFLQWFLSHGCNQRLTNHCLYTVQTALNFAAVSFCCKITLIWIGSSLSVLSDTEDLIVVLSVCKLITLVSCMTPKMLISRHLIIAQTIITLIVP